MASELAAYYVSIVPSAKGLAGKIGKEFAGIDSEASKAGKSSGGAFTGAFKSGMAGIAGAFAAVGIGSFVKDAVNAAGDLEQSVGAIESVFKGSSGQMKQWSKNAASDVGLTANEFNELGTLIGSQLKNGGTAMDQLAPKTKDLIGMGADLSSMFGGSTKDAVDALSSALKGERDPIERYGVSLNQSKIDAEAAALGYEKVGGALSAEATQAATLSLITKQTADAHGNFAKESDTLAHKQQVAAARWGDLKTQIGDVFLPVFSKVIGFFSDKAMPVLTTVVGGVEAFGAAFKANDGDITSKGFAGTMERMAFGAHKLFDSIKTAVAPIATLFATAFSTLGPVFAPLIPQIVTLVTSFSPLGILLKSLAPVLPQIAGLLTVLGKALGGALAQILPTVTDLISSLVGTMSGVLIQILPVVVSLVKSLAGALTLVMPVVSQVIKALAPLVATLIAQLAPIITNLITSVLPPLIGLFMNIVSAIMPLVSVILAMLIPAIQFLMPIIQFAFAVIANVIKVAVTVAAAILTGLIGFIRDVLAPIFGWLYENVIKPVWEGIQTAINAVVDWFTNTALPIIQDVFKNVGAVFTWLYENIIKPVWNGITTVISGVWAFVSGVFNLIVAVIQKVLAPAFNWFWTNVISPVFKFIGAAISFWWNNIVMPVFQAVWGFLKNTLGPVFDWLWKNVIKPVWDGIGGAIKTVWETVVKPVFDTLSKFIKETIPKAFDTGVKAIKTAWDAIQEIAKAPVRFVVNTVINDGLIAGFNALATPLGVKPLGKVALPAGFANGGYTGDGGKYDPAGVVHKGEYVFTKAQTTAIGKDRLAALAAGVAPFPGQGADLWGSVQDDIKRRRALFVNGSAPGWGLPAATAAWNGAAGLAVRNGNGTPQSTVTLRPFVHEPQWAVGYAYEDGGIALNSNATGRLSPTLRRAATIHEIGHVLGLPHVTNRSSVMHPMLASSMQPTSFDIANIQRMYGGKGVPSGDLGDAGFNPLSGIIDGLVQKFKDTFKDAGVFADLAIGVGKKIITDVSAWVGKTLGFGGDGHAATVFDGGGWLENTGGTQLVQHNKRKPDAVLSSSQWDTMTRIADNARGSGFNNYGTIHVRDEEEMARIITTRQRDAQAAYGF